jgi:hypothetical protein
MRCSFLFTIPRILHQRPALQRSFLALCLSPLALSLPMVAQEVPGGALSPGAGAELLRAHNAERSAVGVPPLRWDDTLAASALSCAQRLASSEQLRHCGIGENLWRGPAGRFSPAQMVALWGAERRFFQPGLFPAVSRSGNWADVGHYTQLVWRATQRVGCAAVSRQDVTWLVCQYSPPGNMEGRQVY